jgi:hypothetical protein
LYSEKSIKRIKKIIRNKCAYLVPGVPNVEDIKLAHALDVPLFASEPQKASLLNSNSAALGLFNSLSIPVPLGIYELYEEEEMLVNFSQLI